MIEKLPQTFGYAPINREPVRLGELELFLARDKTNSINLADDFNCLGYAFTLKANADREGIMCGVVTLYYNEQVGSKGDSSSLVWNAGNITVSESRLAHAINVFYVRLPRAEYDLSSFGLPNVSQPIVVEERDGVVFVEPQDDHIAMNLTIGKSYSIQMYGVNSNSPWNDAWFNDSYLKDDIIRKVNIFWGSPYENQLDYGRRLE
jgi:hypothetical protein